MLGKNLPCEEKSPMIGKISLVRDSSHCRKNLLWHGKLYISIYTKMSPFLIEFYPFQRNPMVLLLSTKVWIQIQCYFFYPQKFEFKSRYARALRLNLRFNLVLTYFSTSNWTLNVIFFNFKLNFERHFYT